MRHELGIASGNRKMMASGLAGGTSGLSGTTRTRLMLGGGLIGILCLLAYGVNQMRRPAVPSSPASLTESRPLMVVAAARPILKGQSIGQADIRLIPGRKSVPVGALVSTSAAANAVATTDIAAGQPITTAMIRLSQALAAHVPDGFRALSLQTTDENAVAGLIAPGDHVDVQMILPGNVLGVQSAAHDGSEALTLLSNVMVLAVGPLVVGGSHGEGESGAAQPARTVTLALTPEQASQFVLGRSLGSIFLALRNPADGDAQSGSRAVLADLRGGAGTAAVRPPVRKMAAHRTPGRPVELVVGGERRVIYAGGAR